MKLNKHETSERDEIFKQPLFVDVITRDENTLITNADNHFAKMLLAF